MIQKRTAIQRDFAMQSSCPPLQFSSENSKQRPLAFVFQQSLCWLYLASYFQLRDRRLEPLGQPCFLKDREIDARHCAKKSEISTDFGAQYKNKHWARQGTQVGRWRRHLIPPDDTQQKVRLPDRHCVSNVLFVWGVVCPQQLLLANPPLSFTRLGRQSCDSACMQRRNPTLES